MDKISELRHDDGEVSFSCYKQKFPPYREHASYSLEPERTRAAQNSQQATGVGAGVLCPEGNTIAVSDHDNTAHHIQGVSVSRSHYTELKPNNRQNPPNKVSAIY
ncbi:hypothetical protein CA11_13780 [Gimesia maris]|nr:hypothetical protein CA11_13780 [Gimesia maris]